MADKIKINRRKDYREQLRLYLSLVKSLNAKLKKLFKKVSIKASIEYKQGLLVDDIFFLEYSDELYKILAAHFRNVIKVSGRRLIKQRVKQSEDEINTLIEEYIILHTAAEVTNISETTRKKLTATIQKGINNGDSIDDISRDIKKSSAFSTSRATLIARTETHNAMNEGTLSIAKNLDLAQPVKEWNNALDNRSRNWHKRMDGKTKPIDEKFTVVTPTKFGPEPRLMNSPGDSQGGAANVCNCRCFLTFYDKEDEIIS